MCGRQDSGLSAILSATFTPNGRQNGFIFRWFWRTSSPNGAFLLSNFSLGRFLFFRKFAKVDFAGNHVRGFHLAVHVDVGVNIGCGGKAGMPQPHLHLFHCDFVLDSPASPLPNLREQDRVKCVLRGEKVESRQPHLILFFSWLFLQPAGEGVWGRGTRRDPIPIKRYSFPLDSFDRRNKVAE